MSNYMMWYKKGDDISIAIDVAASYFLERYGRRASIALVHPANATITVTESGIKVVGKSFVLPNHYWIGDE